MIFNLMWENIAIVKLNHATAQILLPKKSIKEIVEKAPKKRMKTNKLKTQT